MSVGFWDRMAGRYAATKLRDPKAYEEKLRRIRAHLTPSSEVLEMGCGTGSTAVALAPSCRKIIATDFSSAMLEIARDKARAEGVENIRFECLPVEDLDRLDRSFDMVLAQNLFHLLATPGEGIRIARDRLRPGGLLVSSTFCLADASWKLRMLAGIGRLSGRIPKITPLERSGFEAMLTDAGFEILETLHPRANAPVFHIARRRN